MSNYGVDWYPPDPRDVPCDILMYGYRPLPDSYCCKYATPTDLELLAQQVAVYNQYNPLNQQRQCCRNRIGGFYNEPYTI